MRTPKPPPRPPAIVALLAEITQVANGPLIDDYLQAYEFAYLAGGWRPESAGRRSIGESDPTGEIAVDGINEGSDAIAGKERIRLEAFTAYDLLGKALDNMRQAAQALQRAMPKEKRPLEAPLYPRTVKEAELRESGVKNPDGTWSIKPEVSEPVEDWRQLS